MTKIPNLWPEGMIAQPEISPLAILKTQAACLGEKTKNLVKGEVVTKALNDKMVHLFYLVVPTLDNYRYCLFETTHCFNIKQWVKESGSRAPEYPLEIKITSSRYGSFRNEGGQIKVENEHDFLQVLRDILSSPETIQTVNSLLSTAV